MRPLKGTAFAPADSARTSAGLILRRRVQRLAPASRSRLDGFTQRLPARSPLACRANAIRTLAARSSLKLNVVPTGALRARRPALTAVRDLPTRKRRCVSEAPASTGGSPGATPGLSRTCTVALCDVALPSASVAVTVAV